MVDVNEFGKALKFVMLIGAARADCTLQQFAALQAQVDTIKALIRHGQYQTAELVVRRVMGDDWEPSEEWTLRNE
jgi:Flp pilus assembly protein TadD